MTNELVPDLNTTIAAAVKARIEAELLKAFTGDETLGKFIVEALQRPVEQKDANYRTKKVPWLSVVLRESVEAATKEALARLLIEETKTIEAEIAKVLKAQVKEIAGSLAESLVKTANSGYGIRVELHARGV